MVMAGTLALVGCGAGVKYVLDEYTGVTPVQFDVAGDDTYRVFDKPTQNKLMITPSMGRAVAMGAGQGVTFGAADTSVPKPLYERAALGYLESTGRRCKLLDGYNVLHPQWEFKYDCSIPPAPAPVAQRKR